MIESCHRFGPFAKIFLAAMARYAPDACAPAFAATILHWLEKPVLPPQKTASGDVA